MGIIEWLKVRLVIHILDVIRLQSRPLLGELSKHLAEVFALLAGDLSRLP
jgi:hypothetical protein